ncbi:hypothetical protein CTAM01_15960 [Colletotrichum tamarilloi]|uniref:Uncharacterized protein n=1 Tax=Colletotrichum tamarilloi TaxID=1209934 RepID=A0ABQ9QJW4_9PEZI|nr:uncharacterized protein CTAM01_15960 [Colletotrichum tamarilloi]KAK1474212.1 hypothetical protein CTAM01_15960 [Colletotrichum tamarilloi]
MHDVAARRADRSAAQGDRRDQGTIRWLAVPYRHEAYSVLPTYASSFFHGPRRRRRSKRVRRAA